MSLLSWFQGLFDKEEEQEKNVKISSNSSTAQATGKTQSKTNSMKKSEVQQPVRTNVSQAKKQTIKTGTNNWQQEQAKQNREQYTILDTVPQQKKVEISLPFVQPIDTSPMILTEETTKKNRMPDLLGQVTLGNQPKRETKQQSSFPTFGEIQADQRENAKTTDTFLPMPNAAQRVGAWAGGAMNSALYDIDQAGTFALEQGVRREQERTERLKQIADEMEEARKTGDIQRVMELQTEKNQLAAQTNSFFSALDLSGWKPQEPEENPFYGEMLKNDELLKRGLTPAAENAANLTQTAGNMLANATVSAASGVSLPIVNAVSQFGQAGTEALEKGHDPDTALQYALASGALSYGIEKMGGAAGDWGNRILQKAAGTQAGQNLLSKVPETALQYIQSLSQNKVAQLIGDGLSEGGEEFGEYSLQLLLQNMMLDEDTPFDVKEALANAGAGVLFGTAFKAGDLLTDLDVSGMRTGLEKGIRQGEIKPEFTYPLLNPKTETRENADKILGDQQILFIPGEESPMILPRSSGTLDNPAGSGYDTGSTLKETSTHLTPLERNGQNGIIRGSETDRQGTGTAGGTAAGIGRTPDTGGKRENLRRTLYQVSTQLRDMGGWNGAGGYDGGPGRGNEEIDRANSRSLNEYVRNPSTRKIRTASGNTTFYKPASVSPDSNAGKAKAILDSLGIPADVAQGEILIHGNGRTISNNTGLTVRGRKGPVVLLHDNLDIDGENTGYHEAYHYIGNTAPELREAFLDTLADNIDYNEDFQNFVSRITGGYITPEKMAADPEKITDKILEEFGAYVCGETQAQNPSSEAWRMIKGFLKDPDAVYESMLYMLRDFKKQSAGNSEINPPTQNIGGKPSDKWNVTPDEADFSQEDHLIKPWIITPKENLLDDSLVDWEPDAESGLSLPESVQKARQDFQGNVDTSILSVPEPNFNSPLLLNQRAMREREVTRDLVDKREQYLAERKARTQEPEPTPPPEMESFVPEQSDLQEAESFLNQQAETSAPDRIRTETEQKAQNQFFQKMQGYLPVSGNNTRENFRKALDAIGTEYQALGRVSPERAIRIFSELYDSARVTNNEYYNQYRPLKEEIRNTRFYLSDTDRTNISDFESFRKANVGNFTVTKDLSSGIPVDVKYRELSDQYPELFPNDITNPAAQLERISEISKGINPVQEDLDSYYGREASEIRRQAQEVFWNELHTYLQTLDNESAQRIKPELSAEERNNIEKLLTRKDKGILDDPRQADILLEAYQNVRRLQPEAYREGLLDSEKHYIDGIVDGSITLDQVPDTEAKDLIQAVASARIALNEARKPIEEYNAARQKEEVDWAKMALIDSDLWKDKMTGLQYQRETMERNIRDITADKGKAEQIIDHYFTPVHEHEAQKQRFLNQYRDQLRKMKLTKEESQWVQKIGEGVEPMSSLPVYLDAKRIESAITLLRDKIYPEIYNMVSDALMLNGYAPPGHIQGYFPHFTEPDDPLTNLLKMVGMDVDFRELPTEIAGTTETRKPGKSFFANLLHRQGDQTEYDALKGLDLYLEGAGNVIFHTEDIQKLRALENVLREKYGRKVNNYRDDVNRQNMPVEYFKDQETEEVFGKDLRHLSKFVTELRSYTNSLAGKKSIADRDSEHKLGRGFYSLSKELENRVAANMVGVNPSSWLTNFVPLTQGAASISKKNLAQAIMDTGDNLLKNDGFEQNSTFLTNRLGSKKVSQSGVERVSDALTKPMEVVDMTTANILVRGRYLDNLEKGMDAKKAMSEADKWTASLMADRSKGALPTIFNEKNFLTRLSTMFQVEVNNQWSYLFKDLSRDSKNAKALISAAVQMALYSYLANELYEDVTGRRPAFDPIGWGEEFKGDFEEEGLNSALQGLGENAMEQIPFTTALNFVGIEGGGRYPIESAIPDLTKVWDVTFGENSDTPINYRAETALKEIAKPTYYLLPPVGGGQAKKTLEGMDALLNAGSYKTNKEGGKDLQYPVDTDLLSALKILAFGKSSTPQAQGYYETWKPVQPDTVEGQADAMAKSLPRIVSYTTGEGPNKKEGSVTLSAGQQRQYQELFLDMLPENFGDMPSEKQDLYFDYAEQAATDKILEDAGVSEYEPEGWANDMKTAVDAGISAEDYLEIKEFFDTIDPQETGGRNGLTAAEIKRQNLMDNQKLTPEQKLLLDQTLIGGDSPADYTDENSFYRSQMSDDRKKQYDAAAMAVPGISAQEFNWVMNSLSTIHSSKDKDGNTVEGSKKQKQIDYLLERGFSLQEAYDLYNIQDLPSNFTSASEYGPSYDAYSESMKKQYQAVVSLFGETKTSTFEYYRDLVQGISGSSQKAEALIQNGFTERQAKAFLSALSISEKDEVDFSNSESVLVSTLSDSQKSKYSAVLNYIPGMPVSDYVYFRDSIENVQGIRDQNGKTISGTAKQNKISALMQMGMNYHQALVFYNIVG